MTWVKVQPYSFHFNFFSQIFKHLIHVPKKYLTTTRNEAIAAAACRLIANSITSTEIDLAEKSSVPWWKEIVEMGLKHRNKSVQEAAADAMAQVSRLGDCTADLSR